MKKLTVGLIGTALVLALSGSAWAQSALRIDLGGNGIGLSISDGQSSFSVHTPAPYQSRHYYSGYYPTRPYLGWGGYRGHNHHYNRTHLGHHRSGHHHKSHSYNHQRRYKRGHNGHHNGNHQRQDRNGRHWRR